VVVRDAASGRPAHVKQAAAYWGRQNALSEKNVLRERVEEFIANRGHPEKLHALLNECVAAGTLEALMCVRRLYESDYGGMTFSLELKAPAASTLIFWGQIGVQALLDGLKAYPTFKNESLCVQLLSSVAAGSAMPPLAFLWDDALAAKIEAARAAVPDLIDFCRARLVDLVLSIDSDDDVASLVGRGISNTVTSEVPAAKELFWALSARWLAVSRPVLERYDALIVNERDKEPAFQEFLSKHPQLLDPMAVQIWPQPNVFGSKFPDFVIRRADDSYIVVEIETPAKTLVTSGGQLSAEVTGAEQQATDYRTYLMQRFQDARLHFPKFDDPDCLVVIGLERDLEARQKAALRDANRHRHRLRIVGFDWLADRARTVASNITRHHVEVTPVRIT
jgi:hypothetical protein